jgi:hypothetical protein
MFEAHFYTFDLFVGFSLPAYFHLRHHFRRHRRRGSRPDTAGVLQLFWLGVVVGLAWEIPIFLSASFAADPIVEFIREPPLHPLFLMIAHTFWDGGLFLAGLALVQALSEPPVLSRFRWQELVLFTAWGQASALAVEVVSIVNEAWVYAGGHAWNPVLFSLSGHPITAIPQLIWLVAPVTYYFLASRLVGRGSRRREHVG